MIDTPEVKDGPLVTVLTPTFNRRRYLPGAIRSVLNQTYRNFQFIVANDGGEDVADIVESMNDHRVLLLQRPENRGKSATLNEALEHARGKYVCYLDDDDLYYPNHLQVLVAALEGQTDCQVAYSDLYTTIFRRLPDGTRQVLAKVVNISRDFDRFFMLHYNHVLHVSVMHRRDLLDRTGGYNEDVRVLIDWDMTRRLAFYSDFFHVWDITGEFYVPELAKQSDRISYKMRQDSDEYLKNFLTIRTTRPPKPWPKMKDLSIVFAPDRIDKETMTKIGALWRWTFPPYQLYLALPPGEAGLVDSRVPNVVHVPVQPGWPWDARADKAIRQCTGDFIALLPSELILQPIWVEIPVYTMWHSAKCGEAIYLKGAGRGCWGAVFRKDELLRARRNHPHLSIRRSVEADNIRVRWADMAEFPFVFDHVLKQAQALAGEGSWLEAARMFERNHLAFDNDLWMRECVARSLHESGTHDAEALTICREINQVRPTVNTLLLEAKVLRKSNRLDEAVRCLERAKETLDWNLDGKE